MAIYRSIQMTFWTDIKISENFTPEDKYFYLYLFTNPHTNLAGCYEISLRQMVSETGYSKETIERLIKRFSEIHKVAFYSYETCEVLLVNWHKYNWTTSEKFRKPLETQIKNIKFAGFKEYLTYIFEQGDTVSIPYAYPMDTICIDTSVTDTVTVNTINNNTTNNINNNNINNIYSTSFEDIYKEYPRKGEKKKAYKCFQTRLKEGYSAEELLIATRNYAEQCKKENRENQYIKMAATFFGVNTPFVDFLPKGGIDNYSRLKEYGRKLYEDEDYNIPPYFGFPPEWFDGEQLVEERIIPLVCDKAYVQGGREDYEFTVGELKRLYESRKRGKEHEQFFNDIFDS